MKVEVAPHMAAQALHVLGKKYPKKQLYALFKRPRQPLNYIFPFN